MYFRNNLRPVCDGMVDDAVLASSAPRDIPPPVGLLHHGGRDVPLPCCCRCVSIFYSYLLFLFMYHYLFICHI